MVFSGGSLLFSVNVSDKDDIDYEVIELDCQSMALENKKATTDETRKIDEKKCIKAEISKRKNGTADRGLQASDDISGEVIPQGEGYLVSSKELLENPCYWRNFEKQGKAKTFIELGLAQNTDEALKIYLDSLKQLPQKNWLLSHRSASIVGLADDLHRQYAKQWWGIKKMTSGKLFTASGKSPFDEFKIPGKTDADWAIVSKVARGRARCKS